MNDEYASVVYQVLVRLGYGLIKAAEEVQAESRGEHTPIAGLPTAEEPPFPPAPPQYAPLPAPVPDQFATCPAHRQPWRLVPAGISKTTGRSYDAFYACPTRGCDQRPPRDWRPQ